MDKDTPPIDNPPSKPVSIHFSALQATSSISALGLVAARMLQEHHQVTLMVSTDGFVEVVPLGELELDLLDESSALQALIERDYTDQQLSDYLKQRSIRLGRAQAEYFARLEGDNPPLAGAPEHFRKPR